MIVFTTVVTISLVYFITCDYLAFEKKRDFDNHVQEALDLISE